MPTAISTLTPRVVVHALGLPEPLAEMYLRDAAIDFCRESRVLYGDLTDISVTSGDASYTLTISADERPIAVLGVKFDGLDLVPVQLDSLRDDWQSDTGTPQYYYMSNEVDLVLYPVPDTTGTLKVSVARAPTRTAASIDDTLADQWLDGVVAGALARALIAPNTPYSNPQLATFYAQEFAKHVSYARITTAKSFTRTSLRIQPLEF